VSQKTQKPHTNVEHKNHRLISWKTQKPHTNKLESMRS